MRSGGDNSDSEYQIAGKKPRNKKKKYGEEHELTQAASNELQISVATSGQAHSARHCPA